MEVAEDTEVAEAAATEVEVEVAEDMEVAAAATEVAAAVADMVAAAVGMAAVAAGAAFQERLKTKLSLRKVDGDPIQSNMYALRDVLK